MRQSRADVLTVTQVHLKPFGYEVITVNDMSNGLTSFARIVALGTESQEAVRKVFRKPVGQNAYREAARPPKKRRGVGSKQRILSGDYFLSLTSLTNRLPTPVKVETYSGGACPMRAGSEYAHISPF